MAEAKVVQKNWSSGLGIIVATLLVTGFSLLYSECPGRAAVLETGQPVAECLACPGQNRISTARGAKTVSLYVDTKTFSACVYGNWGGSKTAKS